MRYTKRSILASLTLVPSVTIAISMGSASRLSQQNDPTREAIIYAGASQLGDPSESEFLSSSALNLWRLNLELNNPSLDHIRVDSCAYTDCVKLKYIRDCRQKIVTVYRRNDGTWAPPYIDVMCSSN